MGWLSDGLFPRRGQGAKWLVASGQWLVVGEHQSRRSPGDELTTGHLQNSAPSAPPRERVFPFFGREGEENAWQPPTVQTPLAHHPLDKAKVDPFDFGLFSRRGAEGAEVERERGEATYCETVACNCVKKGNLSFLRALCASARACLSLFWPRGRGKRMATTNGSTPLDHHPLDKAMV